MKFSKFLAALALMSTCLSASAGMMVYSNNGPIAVTGNSDNAFPMTPLTKTLTDGILVDFTLNFSGSINGNDFLALWLGYDTFPNAGDRNLSGSHTTGPNIGLKGDCGASCASSNDLFVRTTGTDGNFLNGSALSTGVNYHLFGHLYKTAGSTNYNQFDAWLNPTSGEMLSLNNFDARFTGNSGLSSINTFGFRSANLDSGDGVTITNLRIQAVPEPGSLALLGIGILGLGTLRRKSRI